MSKRLKRAKAVWTRSAISIQASSRVIGLRQQAGHTEAPEPERKKSLNTPLNPKGRPHTVVHEEPVVVGNAPQSQPFWYEI